MKDYKIVTVSNYIDAGIGNVDFRHMCLPKSACDCCLQFLFAQITALDVQIRAAVKSSFNDLSEFNDFREFLRHRNELVNFYLHLYAALNEKPCDTVHLIKLEEYEQNTY